MYFGPDGLFNHIADVKTPWSLAAFAIAGILAAFNLFMKKPAAAVRRSLWLVVAAMCLIAILPITVATMRTADPIYRVRVTTVNRENNVPVEGTLVRVTAANENKTAPDGSCELAVPKASLPQDGKITIFADKSALHGRLEMKLDADPNPSVIIYLERDRTSVVSGMVQDERGYVVKDARVSIPGIKAVISDENGNFSLPAQAAVGQEVLLHVEKSGYEAVDQLIQVGEENFVVKLPRESRTQKQPR